MKPQRVRRRSLVVDFDPLAPPLGGWPLTEMRGWDLASPFFPKLPPESGGRR